MLRFLLAIGSIIFGRDTIRASYRNLALGEANHLGIPGLLIKGFIWPLSKTRVFSDFVKAGARRPAAPKFGYSKTDIDQSINAILDMPDVQVISTRTKTINFLVPAFSIETMSAGFFGVFQVALMIAREGFSVRLVMFDNFPFDKVKFRENLQKYPGLEDLFDKVEVDYIGDRYLPLKISPQDCAVATVWYSAYFARKVMSAVGGGPFLYLIQDYEAAFYPFSSLYSFADATYSFDYHALVSTKPLLEFMRVKNRHFDELTRDGRATYFNNACSAILPDRRTFIMRHRRKSRRLAFYSRPTVNRNMFELGARALIEAWTNGYFDTGHNWELYGIGIGDVEIHLDARTKLTQLPRMSLAEYEEKISEFDICLSLMASPHPSITPFDLAGVGAIVVTNHFENKTSAYFENISGNILVAAPDVPSLAEALKSAACRTDDLDTRFDNAASMAYPRDWQAVWNADHRCLVKNLFGSSRSAKADRMARISAEPFDQG